MGSEQSTSSDRDSGRKQTTKQDELPHSTSRRIASGSSALRPQTLRQQTPPSRATGQADQRGTSKHNIVVVADGSVTVKDADPELTRLNTIPVFKPIIKSSLNVVSSVPTLEVLEQIDHHALLLMCLRYQDHLKQLAEAVAFDQNMIGARIKEVYYFIQVVNKRLIERQKKYQKYLEQFGRVTEIVRSLDRIKTSMDSIAPRMDTLNQMLPGNEQLEPFALMPGNASIQSN